MDLPRKGSKNVEDRTGYDEIDHFLNTLFVRLNPYYARHKIREHLNNDGTMAKLVEDGVIPPRKKKVNWK